MSGAGATTLTITRDHGYVAIVAVCMYLTQQLVMIIPVAKARKATGIKAPTLYPRDSEIKALQLKPEQVQDYLCAQRAHQNNVEVMSVFMPLFVLAGLFSPFQVAAAGAVVTFFRIVGMVGYLGGPQSTLRKVAGLFHLAEIYLLYILGSYGMALLRK